MHDDSVEARFQTSLGNSDCRCELCPRHCTIRSGKYGFCLHRYNDNGKLYAARYGRVAALAVDPIEKKPLYHFHPGKNILSAGSVGCNLSCKFCQNWQLSTGQAGTRFISPQELAQMANKDGSIGLAFTYNEPMIWFEYILDTAKLLREQGSAVVLVTNGYLETEPFAELAKVVDAMNVDVKGDEKFYRDLTGGHLSPVRRNVETAIRAGVHIEITNLLVTGANDDNEQIDELASWLASVSSRIPLHLSRYFPNHHYHHPPTSVTRMEEAVAIAREKLAYVYAGNVSVSGGNETNCPQCGATLVARFGYRTQIKDIDANGLCKKCGGETDVIIRSLEDVSSARDV